MSGRYHPSPTCRSLKEASRKVSFTVQMGSKRSSANGKAGRTCTSQQTRGSTWPSTVAAKRLAKNARKSGVLAALHSKAFYLWNEMQGAEKVREALNSSADRTCRTEDFWLPAHHSQPPVLAALHSKAFYLWNEMQGAEKVREALFNVVSFERRSAR